MNRIFRSVLFAGLTLLLFNASLTSAVTRAQDAEGFYADNFSEPAAFGTHGSGWTSTSSGSSSLGQPATVTWSVAPDGTSMPGNFLEPSGSSGGVNTPSDLISFLDGVHHGGSPPGGSDLTQRAWWGLMNSAFERWDSVSGISFNYESQDDGASIGSRSGVLGTRGDYRLSGHSLDGQTSPTILAFNYFPNNSDMVIDTDEINRWSNPNNDYRLFRNMMMHEIGHGLGLNHIEPKNQSKLMEPNISVSYDGPQFDDILGAHRLYGDVNETGSGNDNYLNATVLGNVAFGQTISIGTDAVDTLVSPDETDFVSIDDNLDVDYFRFSIDAPQLVDIMLTPLGPTYQEGSTANNAQPFISSAKSDLNLTLFDTNGISVLEFSNDAGLGQSEKINAFQLAAAGDYFVKVRGLNDAAQFFQLDITAVPEPTSLFLLLLGSVTCTLTRRSTRNSRT